MALKSNISRFLIVAFTISALLAPFSTIEAGGGPGTKEEVKPFHMEPSGPAKSQKKVIPLEGEAKTNLGIYIFQLDNLDWRVEGQCNDINLLNDSSTNLPKSSRVCVRLDSIKMYTNQRSTRIKIMSSSLHLQ